MFVPYHLRQQHSSTLPENIYYVLDEGRCKTVYKQDKMVQMDVFLCSSISLLRNRNTLTLCKGFVQGEGLPHKVKLRAEIQGSAESFQVILEKQLSQSS